jgi:hypothetical protein
MELRTSMPSNIWQVRMLAITHLPLHHFGIIVFIRNLHHTTLITDISEVLDDLGFCVRRVENVPKNGLPLTLFFVDLTQNDNNYEIFKRFLLLLSQELTTPVSYLPELWAHKKLLWSFPSLRQAWGES